MTRSMTGKCICGATTITATPEREAMDACHCSICRAWSAGPYLAFGCGENIEISKDSPIGVYQSSPWAERVFCKECGTSLVWRTRDGKHNHVSSQIFPDAAAYALTSQIFIDEKPVGYDFANETQKMTGAEVFAMFAPEGEGDDSHG